MTGETAVTVTVGYSDTFADPRGCHCNRRPLYLGRNRTQQNKLEHSPIRSIKRLHESCPRLEAGKILDSRNLSIELKGKTILAREHGYGAK